MNKQGVGLGLVICKSICERLGGQISLRSELDRGTTFEFEIEIDMEIDS